MTRLDAPATGRNRAPILAVLSRWLGSPAGESLRVLEIASGTGQHAVHFAEALPHLRWQPSDVDPDHLVSIEAWRLVCIDEPHADPAQWRWREVTQRTAPLPCVLGTAVWLDGDQVVALGTMGNGPHRGLLCRMPLAEMRRGNASMQWWDGSRWMADPVAPEFVLDDAGPECSLHRMGQTWLHVYSRGFGATTVAVHTAGEARGPWSAPRDVLTPPESREEKPFVYAAKAHPALDAGPGWIAISYAANSFDVAQLFSASGQQRLYWPRFWRLRVRDG